MKRTKLPATCLAFGMVLASPLAAQLPAFNCGSNGSYGPLNITENTTLPLPPDGIFHCTTVTIAGARLSFIPNELNTPVYILATGDVLINGMIDVSGRSALGSLSGGEGGPGGYPGGQGSPNGSTPSGAGNGPGGGFGGSGPESESKYRGGNGTFLNPVNWDNHASAGRSYGNSLMFPLVGGSGGGGASYRTGTPYQVIGAGGGGGGGAILIASNTKIVQTGGQGAIFSMGGEGSYYVASPAPTGHLSGYGSGGAIRLVSPRIAGGIRLLVKRGAGDGRTRIDSFDLSGYSPPPGDGPNVIGRMMTVLPATLPKLQVTGIAGTAINENATSTAYVNLPTGSPANQVVKVRAKDFGGIVPIRVRLTPESGDAIEVDAQIDNTVNNPATVDVPVTLPAGTGINVMVFTR